MFILKKIKEFFNYCFCCNNIVDNEFKLNKINDDVDIEMRNLLKENYYRLFNDLVLSSLDSYTKNHYSDILFNDKKFIYQMINPFLKNENMRLMISSMNSLTPYKNYKFQKTKIFTFHYSYIKNKIAFFISNNKKIPYELLLELKTDKYRLLSRKQIIKLFYIKYSLMITEKKIKKYNTNIMKIYTSNIKNFKSIFINLFYEDIQILKLQRFFNSLKIKKHR